MSVAVAPAAKMPSFFFDGYVLRPAVEADLHLARAWTLGDPFHKASTRPEFWIEQGEMVNSFLLFDAKGPVFFFRIQHGTISAVNPDIWTEVHIQFCDGVALTHTRTRRGMVKGFAWLKKMLSESGYTGLYFYSNNPQLIYFCTNRLGFEWDGRKIVYKVR